MVVRPLQFKQNPSLMSISSNDDEETTEKLISQAFQAEKIYSARQTALLQTTPVLQNTRKLPPYFLKTAQPSQNPQNTQSPDTFIQNILYKKSAYKQNQKQTFPHKISFGSYALQTCQDTHMKFHPNNGIKLTEKQQCLMDNLWHIQTMPHASSFKVQNARHILENRLQTVFDQFPEFEQIISQKINIEFPMVLYELQLRLMTIALNEEKYKGVRVIERTDDDGEGTCLLLLQINLKDSNMPNDLILQFYHNGMIDYIELELNPKTEGIINIFGEKFAMTTGNISTHITPPYIGCKVFSSFPFANDHTYRPARKRIFISHKLSGKDYLKNLAIQIEI
ncbi:hypothetical protein L1987_20703 [Smallanthus sonchifolius]|uniref:Uncharacterized protein n=1 Tax=Smallanthus sonchifolius TaxID=185202 RepID=A0ACB9ISK5_9ASTR|nr:hypothetical protein L1987_20703 [Smallanthus sonchifolius]